MRYFLKLFPAGSVDPGHSVEAINAGQPSDERSADPIRVGDVLYHLEVIPSSDDGDDLDGVADAGGRPPLPTLRQIRDSGSVGAADTDLYGGFCA